MTPRGGHSSIIISLSSSAQRINHFRVRKNVVVVGHKRWIHLVGEGVVCCSKGFLSRWLRVGGECVRPVERSECFLGAVVQCDAIASEVVSCSSLPQQAQKVASAGFSAVLSARLTPATRLGVVGVVPCLQERLEGPCRCATRRKKCLRCLCRCAFDLAVDLVEICKDD